MPVDLYALAAEASMTVVGVAAIWGLSVWLAYRIPIYDQKTGNVLQNPTLSHRLDAADLIFSLPFYPVLVVLAVLGTIALWGDVSSRWYGVTFASKWFQMLYVCRMAMHCPIQWITLKHDKALRLQMTAHHLLSIVCYGGGLTTNRMHFWANMDGICEITTVLLNVVFAFKMFSPKDDAKYWVAKATVGTLLWLCFIVFRLVLFPIWLWWFHQDVTIHPEKTWNQVSAIERYVYAGVTCFLLVVSTMWMVPITKGFLKIAKGTKKKPT